MSSAPGSSAPALLLSRPVEIAGIGASGLRLTIEADAAERQAMARADGLVAIEALSGDLLLRPEGRSGVHLTGRLSGRIVQTCVVTLEPFASDVREDIDVHFLPESEIKPVVPTDQGEEDDLAEIDPPDAIVDGRIDVGAVMAEFLALSLDPYPRKPGAVFVEPAPKQDGDDSPFKALGQLAGRRDGEA